MKKSLVVHYLNQTAVVFRQYLQVTSRTSARSGRPTLRTFTTQVPRTSRRIIVWHFIYVHNACCKRDPLWSGFQFAQILTAVVTAWLPGVILILYGSCSIQATVSLTGMEFSPFRLVPISALEVVFNRSTVGHIFDLLNATKKLIGL